jgi:hypothetical protein
MTPGEIRSIKNMVLSKTHRHMSIRALAIHAQRVGEVLAHPVTWYSERGWIRPRVREFPAKPKVGIRATKPNEAWHVCALARGTASYRLMNVRISRGCNQVRSVWEPRGRSCAKLASVWLRLTARLTI